MAKRLSARQKDELAALLAVKKPTKEQQDRIAELTAGGPCVSCKEKIVQREVKS